MASADNSRNKKSMHESYLLELLEPRIMLSADPFGAAEVAVDLLMTGLQKEGVEYEDYSPGDTSDDTPDNSDASAFSETLDSLDIASVTSLFASQDPLSSIQQFDSQQSDNPQSSNSQFSLQPGDSDFISTPDNEHSRTELIIIDAAVDNQQQLLQQIIPADSQINYQIHYVDHNSGGINQISELLKQYSQIEAVHILSHGNSDGVQLGSSWIDAGTLNQQAEQITQWSSALTEDADILIYGCDVTSSEAGIDFVQTLQRLSGADVAASDDKTGATALGGDWDLEYQSGVIEAQLAFSVEAQQVWQGTLATFVVDTTNDTVDANLGDGFALDGSGNTSLRAAIMEANFLGGADQINLAANTYNLSLGDLQVTSAITLVGADAATTIIDGGGSDRIFHIDEFSSLNASELTLQGGVASGGGDPGKGGAIFVYSDGALTLNRVILSGNQAVDGAGIYNNAVVNLTDVVISGNTTTGGGASEGGGLYNRGDATLTNVTLSGNSAGLGGGIHNDSSGSASIDLTNVTISGNTATGAEGGGIHNENTATLTNVTVSNNSSATQGGGIYTTGTVTISNSILANNTAGGSGPDAFGTFSSDGTNIIENIGPASGFGSDTSGDPNLGALANNGGFTQTHALLGGSIAIDAGTNLNAPPLDQRGYLRTDGLADSGAFEAGATAPGANYVVINTNASGVGSLEWAIDQANLSAGFDTISFNIAGSGPHVISVDGDGLPSISDSVLIDGWSEPDYVNTPVIRIDAGTFPGVNGLWLNSGSDGSIIRGLSMTGFTGNDAIEVTSSGNTIVGNYIGLTTDGTTVDGNDTGIRIRQGASDNQIGGTGAADKNLIAGSSYAGINIHGNNTNNNRIIGNDIGLDASATVVNTGTFGIVIWNRPDGNQVGGTADGEGNRIAGFNKAVVIDSNPQAATNTSILGNQIWGSTQLGIDLENDGISYNDAGDADAGANNQLNFPVFSKVTQSGSNLDVDLLLDVPAGNYRLELFENPAGINASGHGEGQVFLGAVTLVSTGTGVQAFSTSLTGVVVGDINTVAATVTEDLGGGSFGNTSEFSQAPGLPVLIRDEFNNPAYSGNDGHLPWVNDWQEIGEADGPVWDTITTSAVSVWSNFGDDGLDLWAANNLGAWREADLTFASSATLSFDWAMLNTEAGDSVSLQISTDGGVGWTTLDTFDGPLNHGSTQAASYDISAYIDNDTRIKFETVSGFESDDEFFVDNVQIAMTRYESTLWLSTHNSATYDHTDDGISSVGVSNGNEIVAFENPNLNLELGDGSSGVTDGTFSVEHTLEQNVRAMHYVNSVVTVVTKTVAGGEGVYELQPGQIVVSMRDESGGSPDFSVPKVGGGNLTVNNTDVLVYTPGSGYEMLLEDVFFKVDGTTPANVHAITIVEQETTLGVDTTLSAGTYLIARSDSPNHSDISTYGKDGNYVRQDLLLGSGFLDATEHIQGLELLEADLTVGNTALVQGTLLISINKPMTVGTSGGTTVSAENTDIIALTVNATQQDGTPGTDVDAQIVFDGSDVSLSIASSQEINGLTLVGNDLETINSEPTLATSGTDPTFATGGSATSLYSGTSVDTIESGQTLSSLTLTVSNVSDGGNEILNIDGNQIALSNGTSGTTTGNSLSFSVSVVGSTATVSLSGALSAAQADTLIDAISYQHNSGSPTLGDRVVTITELVDSGGTANGGDDTATLSAASTVTVTGQGSEEISSNGAGSAKATAIDASGNHVVVWSEQYSDSSGWGIYAQRFDSTGSAQGSEIQINQTTADDQRWASVGMSDTGKFVVTWTSSNQDGTPSSIYARQFNADGSAAGDEFRVNTENTGAQSNASIDVDASGNFIVVWQGNGPGDSNGVFYRRFDAAGSADDATEVIAHTATDGTTSEHDPVVAWLSGGKFVVAWDSGQHAYFTRFDTDGSALGPANVAIDGGSAFATTSGLSIDSNASGAFAFAYIDEGAFSPGIFARAFNEDGSNAFTNGDSLSNWAKVSGSSTLNPTVAIDDSGNVLVAYQTTAAGGDIHLQSINADGSEPGAASALVTDAGDQSMPTLALLDLSNYALAWNDVGSSTVNTSVEVGVNDEPTLTATGSNPTFTEGGAAASLFSSASVDTIEFGQTLSALTLTITNVNDGSSEILNADGSAIVLTNGTSGTTATNSLSYSVSVTGSTATLTLSGGTLSEAATQTLIDAISYQNNSNDPNSSDRVVTITSLQDSGGTANSGDDTAALSIASTVTLQSVNDEPTLTATGSNPTFTEGGAAASLFSSASVATIESGQTLSALTLTVTNVNDGSSEILNADGSAIVLTNGTSGTTATNSLSYSVSVTGSTATLTLSGGTLSEAATQTLIDAISYQNNSNDPNTSDRVVTITSLQDSGGTANSGDDTAALSIASTVTLQSVNDEPTLTATGSNPTFTEGGAAAGLFSSASVATIESGQTLSALTLTVTNVNDGSSEILNADGSAIVLTNGTSGTTATNILSYSVSVTGSTATLTLSGGTLSTAATQTLIDAISYQNNSNDPNNSDRVVTITQLQDSGGTANSGDDTAALSIASTVRLLSVNDEPTLTATGSNPTFTEGGAAVSLFSGTSVDSIESGQNLIEMWISVEGEEDNADEIINFDGRSIALQNSNTGSTDNFSGFLVYTSAGDKFIYLTTGVGSVTPAVLEGLIDNMTYQNDNSNPTEGTRTITIRGLTDDGGTANGGDDFNAALSVSSEVAVMAANTAPSLSSNNFVLSEGVTTTITPAMLAATDADDANAGLTFTISGISGGQFALSGNPAVAITSFTQSQITSGVVVFVDNGDETTPAFSLSVSDGVNTTAAVPATINFSNVNDAPTLSATASNPTFTEGGSPVPLFSGSSADPIEAGQRFISFTVTVSNVLDGSEETLSLDGEDIELTHGESDDTDNFNYTVSVTGNTATLSFSGGSVTATQLESLINGMRYENDSESPSTGNRVITITELQDNGGGSTDTASLDVASTVTVGAANDDPTLNNAINDQNATEDSFFSFTFAAGTFGDVDAGDTLSYSAALPGGVALPAWLTFDDATRTFSGTPLNANVGTISVTVSADDGNGGTPATDTFDIVVANSNDAPTVANLIPNQNVTEDSVFSFQFAANTFTDMDGDSLNYSATLSGGVALPAWLTFDDTTRTFSGTPLNADVGTTTVVVTANDGNGGSVIDRFDIVITNSNDAPTGSVTINTDGTPAENETLSVTNALADDDGLGAITYHWQRNGSDIGSTGSNYTLVDADVGQTITVEARYTDARGTNEAVLSNSISGITNVNDAPSGAVLISGTFAENEILTASNTLADEDGLGTITYHWQRNGSDIGSTGSSYLLTDEDMGKKITVQARYTDLTGVAERVSSSPLIATVTVDDIESGSSAPLAEKVLVPAEVKEIEDKVAEEKAPVTIKVEADNPPEVVASTAVKFVAPPELPSFEPNEINTNNIKPLALAIGNQTSVMTDLKASWLQLSDPLMMVNSSGLMNGLDQMEKQFQQRIGLDQMVVGSSIAMSTSLSVGYVAWLLRSGVLLSSVLTSLPAWRFIDPLPILSTLGSEEGGVDVYASGEESLEELVQKDNTDETPDTKDL